MASVNGIHLKNVKEFFGHEGESLYQGSLYLNNQKIGQWSQDSWGGPDHFLLDPKYSVEFLNKAVLERNPEKAINGKISNSSFSLGYNLEFVMADYLELAEDEKIYKEAVRKNYAGILIATDGVHQVNWYLPKQYTDMSDDQLIKVLGSDISNAKKPFFKETDFSKHKLKIYRSPDDFIVGEAIKLESITRKGLIDIIHSAESKLDSASSLEKQDRAPER